ncbi:hypothetical protein NGUA38_00070 [Salmonella enterica]|nr:hypothetical protein NGUA38_00070 [Salmonella enterica]
MFSTATSDIYNGELYHLSLCLGQLNTQAMMTEQVFQPDVRCCRSDADSPLHSYAHSTCPASITHRLVVASVV